LIAGLTLRLAPGPGLDKPSTCASPACSARQSLVIPPGTTTSGRVTAPIPYTVVEARPIPRVRQTRVGLIDSAYGTDAALRQL
jgi:hypothetical protein